ncbi:MAG TPA: TrbG/VirB9 family P-type conjugative transfer protein [Candidatus Deferrimicrobiaceae bacterium]|nr:TrbG/VirB9 family P-type conjugative transfer protein [Candidatus Deferrimicrobiaceae bacterium]
MKTSASLILIYSLGAIAAFSQQAGTPSPNSVVHVATALNHLTVLEFHEPVTMAAAGSSDFQIERESNKVFVKPIKSGTATDLFVWTASQRFAYELEITQEPKDMNFAIDSAQPIPAPKPVLDAPTDQFADLVLTRALLGAEEIKQKSGRKAKGQVSVQVEQVFRTRSTVYVHYTIENNSGLFYRVNAPEAYQLKADDSPISLASLAHTQLDRTMLQELGDTQKLALPVAHAEAEGEDLHPGETTQGVISIRQDLKSPAVVQLMFSDEVKATFVL